MRYKYIFPIVFFLTISTVLNAQTQKGADINAEAALDRSGFSVSMPDVNTIAVGACFNSGNGNKSGHVRVYSWNGSTWQQKGNDIDGKSALDNAGWSVCMPDANTVAVGSRDNSDNGSTSGQVRIFTWNGSAWQQKGLDINGEGAGDQSGFSVSMPDVNTIAIGANTNTGNGPFSGHVRVYSWNGLAWVQKGLDFDSEAANDQFGYSVSMPDANHIAIGGPNNNGIGTNAGHVRVYFWKGGIWNQKGVDIEAKTAYERAGLSVSMPDINTIAIGSPNNSDSGNLAGLTRVFKWNGSAWVQKGSGLYGEAPDDYFGWSVSMPDTSTLAVGAYRNFGSGSYSGSVRVYRWYGNDWHQKGNEINGKTAGDWSGWCISMPQANTIAIGSPFNKSNGNESGQARVFTICQSVNSNLNLSACHQYISPSSKYTWTKSGMYSDTILSIGGCDSIITFNLTIDSIDNSITNNSPTLTSNAMGVKYQWLDCNDNYSELSGDTNQVFTAMVNGSYAVEVMDKSCIDTSNCITITNVSIIENNFNSQINVYPNPSAGQVSIDLGLTYNDVKVIVRNALGQEISRKTIANSKTIALEIEGENGIYFIEIYSGEKKAVLRIVKQ